MPATRGQPPSGRSRVATALKVVLPAPVRPQQGRDVTGLGHKVETREGLDLANALGEAS
jgi:hypothetical protein